MQLYAGGTVLKITTLIEETTVAPITQLLRRIWRFMNQIFSPAWEFKKKTVCVYSVIRHTTLVDLPEHDELIPILTSDKNDMKPYTIGR